MEQNLNLPNCFGLILDPQMIAGAIKRAAEWNLPRRECHPLDRRPVRRLSVELERCDAEIEAASVPDEELDLADVIGDSGRVEMTAAADFD
jgi:hypothetical protein